MLLLFTPVWVRTSAICIWKYPNWYPFPGRWTGSGQTSTHGPNPATTCLCKAALIRLGIDDSYFHAKMAELGSCDRLYGPQSPKYLLNRCPAEPARWWAKRKATTDRQFRSQGKRRKGQGSLLFDPHSAVPTQIHPTFCPCDLSEQLGGLECSERMEWCIQERTGDSVVTQCCPMLVATVHGNDKTPFGSGSEISISLG